MKNKTQAAFLLDLVIEQNLELSEYKVKLPELIRAKFDVSCRHFCHVTKEASAVHLVGEIINWENGHQLDSLEATLIEKFRITKKSPEITLK
jgi:hypothetical protein